METKGQKNFSELGPNAGYAEEMYKLYLLDPSLVGESWASYFASLDSTSSGSTANEQVELLRVKSAPENGHAIPSQNYIEAPHTSNSELQSKVTALINCYRQRGHLKAEINPLSHSLDTLSHASDLDIGSYDFSENDLATTVSCDGFAGLQDCKLASLIDSLKKVYCGSVGFEYLHLHDLNERQWLQEKIENSFSYGLDFSNLDKQEILEKLIVAENFESALHKKYVGNKRFSLQGGETVIAMLSTLIEDCGESELKEVVIGMPHRGRLNVLANTLGKPLEDIFSEFEDQSIFTSLGSGDVKYHLGFELDHPTKSGNNVRVSLAPNPSHLEFVNPVVEGISRAKQDKFYDRQREAVLPVLLHGDAAVIGQGVVPETFNLSTVDGYDTGGTIHVVVNNQIGFTTYPEESRSTPYCSEMAKAVQAPVFHINSEDPEAACWAMRLALEFRLKYKRDVVLDLYCYRKYGHNEADDPSYTQPLMYDEIKRKPEVSKVYSKKLIDEGTITQAQVDGIKEEYLAHFDKAYEHRGSTKIVEGCAIHGRLRLPNPDTGVDLERLRTVASTLTNYPEDFSPHPKLTKILEKRIESLHEGENIDWSFAEALALGSLVMESHQVRLSGQDCGRGTFSQRHLALSDYKNGSRYYPLNQLIESEDSNNRFEVYNSPLSEAAVLGFEFGYASVRSNALVIWEAQFGDFANGAQVLIDQFIAASEAKWGQTSGVVMLLPHGYEGQGPEHSSARLERYLQLCAEGNMCVAYPSTASQYFHLIRRQGVLALKRPLIVMTPKSLLRHVDAASRVEELTFGTFHPVLVNSATEPEEVKQLVFLTGKITHEVKKALNEAKVDSAALIRIEQLYPFPLEEVEQVLDDYPNAQTFLWVQEEPENMGAWSFIDPIFRRELETHLIYIGRNPGASTAGGSTKRHVVEQQQILEEVVKRCG